MKNILVRTALGLSIIAGAADATAQVNTITLVNYQSAKDSWGSRLCLGLAGNSTKDGTRFVISKCDSPTATFYTAISPVAGKQLAIFNSASNKVVAVAGGSTNPGADVILWPWISSADQVWTFEVPPFPVKDAMGSQCYRLINRKSNLALGVYNQNVSVGTKTVIWNSNGDLNQYWCVH